MTAMLVGTPQFLAYASLFALRDYIATFSARELGCLSRLDNKIATTCSDAGKLTIAAEYAGGAHLACGVHVAQQSSGWMVEF